MSASQIQLKISLSGQLNELLQLRAARFGVPITQFVKHLIMKEVETETYPVFSASERRFKKAKRALKKRDTAVRVNDIGAYFKSGQ